MKLHFECKSDEIKKIVLHKNNIPVKQYVLEIPSYVSVPFVLSIFASFLRKECIINLLQ